MLDQYLSGLLGDRNVAGWLLAWTFIFIGVIISAGIHVSKRNKRSDATPYKFYFWFWVRDNIIRIAASMFMCFTIIRFGQEISGMRISDFGCIGLGLIFDQLLIVAEKWQNKARKVYIDKETE